FARCWELCPSQKGAAQDLSAYIFIHLPDERFSRRSFDGNPEHKGCSPFLQSGTIKTRWNWLYTRPVSAWYCTSWNEEKSSEALYERICYVSTCTGQHWSPPGSAG